MIRQKNEAAMDTSLIPSEEFDVAMLTISDDVDHALDLTALAFSPLILLVYCDGIFYEGSDATNPANDIPRAVGTMHSLAVNGARSWKFRRDPAAGTIHIRIKALGSM